MSYWFYTLLLIAVSFSSCQADEGRKADTLYPPEPGYRTVLVYMGMDDGNFLSHTIAKPTVELLVEQWEERFNGNLLLYVDKGESSCLIHVHEKAGVNVADTVQVYGKEDSASADVLRRVLMEVKAGWPAQSYGLIVSSHGTGWLPKGTMASPYALPRTIITDEGSGGYEMSVFDFTEAIPYKLDFLIFDACLMGGVEVVYELKEKADYVVVSPAEVLEEGMITGETMRYLMRVTPDLGAFAQAFFERYDAMGGEWRSATVSVVKTSGLEELAELFGEIQRESAAESSVTDAVQVYGYGTNRLYFDLGDYIQKIAPERYEEFMRVLDKSVLWKYATPGYFSSAMGYAPLLAYSGLSVYIPQAAYPYINGVYEKLKWRIKTR